MLTNPFIKAGTAIVATTAVLAGGPALARAVGLGNSAPGPMPVAYEQAKAEDAAQMTQSNELAREAHRMRVEEWRKAEAKRKAEAERRAEEKRKRAEERAARARVAQGGTPAQNRALGMQMCADRGWSASQCSDLGRLWQKESGWDSRAHNGGSGAHGIPQALPGSKMSSHGSDWATSARTQIAWGLDYIAGRYGNPSNAWAHSVSHGWY